MVRLLALVSVCVAAATPAAAVAARHDGPRTRRPARTPLVVPARPAVPTPMPTPALDPLPDPAAGRPYSAASPFNQPVGDHPVVSALSDQIVANSYLANGQPGPLTNESGAHDYSHPVYVAGPADPVLTIRASGGVDGMRIAVPAYAQPAAGDDGHLTVIEPDGWEYDLWQAAVSGDALRASIAYRQRADGPGIVTAAMRAADPTLGGGTAAYFGAQAGIIRASELLAGDIPHALFLIINAGAADTSFGFGTSSVDGGTSVFPAAKGGSATSGVRAPMGARFWLDMTDAEIAATGAPAWEQTIARAAHQYGAYFGDTGGGGFKFMLESAVPYLAAGLPNPMAAVAQRAGIVKDAEWGYGFRFSGKIPWGARLRVIAPPAP